MIPLTNKSKTMSHHGMTGGTDSGLLFNLTKCFLFLFYFFCFISLVFNFLWEGQTIFRIFAFSKLNEEDMSHGPCSKNNP